MNFPAIKIQEIPEISQHNSLVLAIFLKFTNFDQIFEIIAFLRNVFFRNLRFEAKISKILFKCLFYLCEFLVFLACFSCEKFLVIEFLDFLFLMRNCHA